MRADGCGKDFSFRKLSVQSILTRDARSGLQGFRIREVAHPGLAKLMLRGVNRLTADGAASVVARRRKERTYPELVGPR